MTALRFCVLQGSRRIKSHKRRQCFQRCPTSTQRTSNATRDALQVALQLAAISSRNRLKCTVLCPTRREAWTESSCRPMSLCHGCLQLCSAPRCDASQGTRLSPRRLAARKLSWPAVYSAALSLPQPRGGARPTWLSHAAPSPGQHNARSPQSRAPRVAGRVREDAVRAECGLATRSDVAAAAIVRCDFSRVSQPCLRRCRRRARWPRPTPP